MCRNFLLRNVVLFCMTELLKYVYYVFVCVVMNDVFTCTHFIFPTEKYWAWGKGRHTRLEVIGREFMQH